MDKCIPPVRVLRGVHLSDTKLSTLNLGPIPLGEEVTEQMSIATTDTISHDHRDWVVKHKYASPSPSPSVCINPYLKYISSPVSTSFLLPREPDESYARANHKSPANSPHQKERKRTFDSHSLPPSYSCYHSKPFTRQKRAFSVGHLGCIIRSARHPDFDVGLLKSMQSLTTTEPLKHSLLNSESLLGMEPSDEQRCLNSTEFMLEAENEWRTGELLNTGHVNGIAGEQGTGECILLPGRSDFEDVLVREVAQFELCEFLIGELEFLNSIPLLQRMHKALSTPHFPPTDRDRSNAPRAVSPIRAFVPRLIPHQSLLDLNVVTHTNSKVRVQRNLSFPRVQPPLPSTHNQSSFSDIFGVLRDGFLPEEEFFTLPTSRIMKHFTSLNNANRWPERCSFHPDDPLRSRFVTTLAADMVTHCMEVYVGQSEQMAFLKELHQLFMQTCDDDWAFGDLIGNWYNQSEPKQSWASSSMVSSNSAAIPGSSLILNHNSADTNSNECQQRNRRRPRSMTLLGRKHRSPSTHVDRAFSVSQRSPHLLVTSEPVIGSSNGSTSPQLNCTNFDRDSDVLATPRVQSLPVRSNSFNALCSPLPYDLLLRPAIPNSKRRSILLDQRNRCAGCGVFVETRYLRRMRFCEFFGQFFCCVCHSNTLMVLPGNLLSSWDFRMVPVSNIARDRLKQLHRQPLLRLSEFSPRVRNTQAALRNCSVLRKQGNAIVPFVRFCPNAHDLLSNLAQLPPHWLQTPDLWSMADLCAVRSGQLDMHLRATLQPVVDHISICNRCRVQGFICEVCHSGQILFPFGQSNTVSCTVCNACFHRSCLRNLKQSSCPRCLRRAQRRKRYPTRASLLHAVGADAEFMLSGGD